MGEQCLPKGARRPENVISLRDHRPPPQAPDMPRQTPELAILTALFASNPKMMRKAWPALWRFRDGEFGEEGRQALNYINRLMWSADSPAR